MRINLALTPKNMWMSLLLIGSITISACGFQLRGVSNLSFQTVNVQGATLSLSRELIRNLKANKIEVTSKVDDADVVLELIRESNSKRIQSLSGTGVVREFELYYQVSFRSRVAANPLWGNVQTINLRRDYSYNDEIVLGKAEEEARLNADMRSDAIREIIRRLSALKVPPKTTDSTEVK